MKKINAKSFHIIAVGMVGIIFAGCAGSQQTISLIPGSQIANTDVDLTSGSVTQTLEDVEVSVKGVILPSSEGESLHPTFWVTVTNNRDDKITLNPAKARLVDSNGDQYRPLGMSLNNNTDEKGYYQVIDPNVRSFYSGRYGYHYYPFYPHRSYRLHGGHRGYGRHHYYGGHRGRGRYHYYGSYNYYSPFWSYGGGAAWTRRVKKVTNNVKLPDREEVLYDGAKITYALTFPELKEEVEDYLLIIPEVNVEDEDGTVRSLKFKVIFDQIVKVDDS